MAVRKSYGLLVALDHDFPGTLGEVVLRVDLYPRGSHHDAAWFGRYLRLQVLTIRHEQVQAQPPVKALAELTAGIGN